MSKITTFFTFLAFCLILTLNGVRSHDDITTIDTWPDNSGDNEEEFCLYESDAENNEECSYEEEAGINWDSYDNETCLNDENCHRNVTVCFVENCCAFKECDENGECVVAMPDCVAPEEEYYFVDDETCLNDERCHRNVTVCYVGDCCAFKQCDENGECAVAMPDCLAPEEEYHFVDNETCLNDENCHRNVTVCYVENCCAFKECDENGECLVAMPDCIMPPEEEEEDEEDEDEPEVQIDIKPEQEEEEDEEEDQENSEPQEPQESQDEDVNDNQL